MPAAYDITIDPRRKMIAITFSGFFSDGDVASYIAAKNAALAALGCRPHDHVTLCDFTACGPQRQDILALFKRSLDDPLHRSRRLAVVVSSALATMQVRHVLTRPDSSCFRDRGEAEAWLVADSAADGGIVAPVHVAA